MDKDYSFNHLMTYQTDPKKYKYTKKGVLVKKAKK